MKKKINIGVPISNQIYIFILKCPQNIARRTYLSPSQRRIYRIFPVFGANLSSSCILSKNSRCSLLSFLGRPNVYMNQQVAGTVAIDALDPLVAEPEDFPGLDTRFEFDPHLAPDGIDFLRGAQKRHPAWRYTGHNAGCRLPVSGLGVPGFRWPPANRRAPRYRGHRFPLPDTFSCIPDSTPPGILIETVFFLHHQAVCVRPVRPGIDNLPAAPAGRTGGRSLHPAEDRIRDLGHLAVPATSPAGFCRLPPGPGLSA